VGDARPLEAFRHMSETRLRAGGHTATVALTADRDGSVATLDGTIHRVTRVHPTHVATVGGATVEEIDLELDGRSVRALVARTRDRIHVAVAGHTVVFELVDDAHGGGTARAGSGSVIAPMPGKVVKVLVAAGDAVTAGQPLVVIEAMKMETTLAAEIDGTVRTVAAEPGAMIDAGSVLVEIAPAPSEG
jgi:3-methylcrotonyl-CoA carboxylase alpha subunit